MVPSFLPQVMFEGVRGSTAYLDISLDAISIHRGSCNRSKPVPLPLSLLPEAAQGGRSSTGTTILLFLGVGLLASSASTSHTFES